MHAQNSFITLTYDDAHLPSGASSDEKYSGVSLDIRHWQLFAKKLRKHLVNEQKCAGKEPPYETFRFFHCGEYGSGNGKRKINPHYHAIIFGQDFSADRKFKEFTSQGHQTFTSDTLTRIWGKGRTEIGSVTMESASYVARYCMKRQGGDKAEKHYKGRKPEYASMSRNPGLGSTWFQKYKSDVFPHDFIVTQEGHKTRVPKYYDTQLTELELEQIKILRVQAARKHSANNTPERLLVREQVLESKLSTLQRKL